VTHIDFRLAEVPPDSGRVVGSVANQDIAVFNVGGNFCATLARCTHLRGPLVEGTLSGTIVTCPLHGSQFDVSTGMVIRGPATQPLETFPVETDGTTGQINIDDA
jgi:nitrite reductase/ring-hydroxylating ferredoxin subunit